MGCSESQAEEIIQEVMIAVWTKSKTYNSAKSSVSTWIYTIAKNKRIDKITQKLPQDIMLIKGVCMMLQDVLVN